MERKTFISKTQLFVLVVAFVMSGTLVDMQILQSAEFGTGAVDNLMSFQCPSIESSERISAIGQVMTQDVPHGRQYAQNRAANKAERAAELEAIKKISINACSNPDEGGVAGCTENGWPSLSDDIKFFDDKGEEVSRYTEFNCKVYDRNNGGEERAKWEEVCKEFYELNIYFGVPGFDCDNPTGKLAKRYAVECESIAEAQVAQGCRQSNSAFDLGDFNRSDRSQNNVNPYIFK